MIDLTPLDVRKKAGDLRRVMRGFDPQEVESFLELTAERMEELVKENLTLRERVDRLQEQVSSHEGRERAVQEALVVAQQLRSDLKEQAEREAELRLREVEAELQRRVSEVDVRLEERHLALEELERRRLRFLKSFRSLLQRELEAVEVEESRTPLEEKAMDLELGGKARAASEEGKGNGSAAGDGSAPAGDGKTGAGKRAAAGEGEALWLSSVLNEDAEETGGGDEEAAS